MLRRSKRTLVAAAVAAVAIAVLPLPTPASAMSPCQAKSISSTQDLRGAVLVVGAYTTAGATDVQLTCGVVKNGVTIARFSENLSGPVAAVEGTTTAFGSFSACYELFVTYVDRQPTYSDVCP